MVVLGENKIGVSAQFDSGRFMNFSVFSCKNPTSYNSMDSNIQSVENLSFEEFTALEAIIANSVDNFIKMKNKQHE